MYRALYRKWRPRDFDDVCGQEQITGILKYEVAEKKTSHAYLFCGSRGTGKTSCAKILAKAVNCENPQNGNPCNACAACHAIDAGIATDVIEMDAASNTGVDNVRDIKDEIIFTPAELRYRVYIIDEVHMMSGSAFNALLKTLEEPPEHVLFVLATTELQKLPATIVSRCQRFDFKRLSSPVIVDRLTKIAKEEGIPLETEGARILARMALGGMRDAISLLELCAGLNRTVDAALVTEVLGSGNRAATAAVVRAVLARDYETIYSLVAEEVMSSRDLFAFFRELMEYYRDLLVAKTGKNAAAYLDLSDVEASELSALADKLSLPALLYHTRLLEDAISAMQRGDAPRRAIVEITLTRMCEPKLSTNTESLLARIDALESEISKIKLGRASNAPAPAEEVPEKADEPSTPSAKMPEKPKPADTPAAPRVNDVQISTSPVAKAPAAPAATGKPVFRAIAGWRDIIERVGRVRPGMGGFLESARAYRGEDKTTYLINVSSSFTVKMLTRPESLDALRMAIAEETGADPAALTLHIVAAGEETGHTLIDEIEEALSE